MSNPCAPLQQQLLEQAQDWVNRHNRQMENGPAMFLEQEGYQQPPLPSPDGGRPGMDLYDYAPGLPIDRDAHPDLARELGVEMVQLPLTPAEIKSIGDIVAFFREADTELRQRVLDELKPYLPERLQGVL